MALSTLPVADYFTRFLFLDVVAKTTFGSSQQRKSAAGVPLWTVEVLATSPDGAEHLKITVAAELDDITEALALAEPAQPVEVVGLRAGAYANRAGRAEFYWTAEAVLRPAGTVAR
jgi:hypothetical protein